MTTLVFMLAFFNLHLSAATFYSVQTGDWDNAATWGGAIPAATDAVHINAGHVVTIDQNNSYTHQGNLTINVGGELIAKTGNSVDGFVFSGPEFHVFGTLTLPFPDRDLSITGNSLFWGHPSAVIFISDDWKISGNSETIIEGICVEVDDDFHIKGTKSTLCGGGGVSIGAATGSNTFNLENGAKVDQVCDKTIVYRGVGGNCTTVVAKGSGNAEPVANPDTLSTGQDVAVNIDVLDLGTPDNDPDGDDLTIVAVGSGGLNSLITEQGGTVAINNNGTNDPTDDFVSYTPPTGFSGIDYFDYVITDENGAYQIATVVVTVTAVLPVELTSFRGKITNCEVDLEWSTESEVNSDYFEVQRSGDGYDFKAIGSEEAAGFSTRYRTYDFTDDLPSRENYYRLKMVDIDGSTEYSDVIFVESDCISDQANIGIVALFPNPAIGSEINLRFNANQEEEVLLLVSDLYGKNLRSEMILINKGMNSMPLDIADYQAGTYVVTIGQRTQKFIKTID